MSSFDIVVFGATGFTGERVARDVSKHFNGSWALAGRTESKLVAVRDRVVAEVGDERKVGVIAGIDTSNAESVERMCSMAKIIINCVGPFRFYGEPVVAACAALGTHYVDITGEPEFIERMMTKYGEQAEESGAIIVPCCGFDSVPADLGCQHARDSFRERFPEGALSSIEAVLNIRSAHGFTAHYATYESAVHGMSSADKLRKNRRVLRNMQTDDGKLQLEHVGKRPPVKTRPFVHKTIGKWCLLFPGSDKSVVDNSLYFENKRVRDRAEGNGDGGAEPVPYYSEYFTISSTCNMILFVVIATLFSLMVRVKCLRRLVLKFPRFFSCGLASHEGPSQKQLDTTSFSLVFFGRGYRHKGDAANKSPDILFITRVSGPEPGYVATPTCVVSAALSILKERDNVPYKGGVITPAAALARTNMIRRLTDNGLEFAVVSEDEI